MKPVDARKDIFEEHSGNLITGKHSLLSLMLPPAVKEFYAEPEAELREVCGERYSRDATGKKRWGSQQSRQLGDMNILAVLIDGKRFHSHGVVIALGVGRDGLKHVLGIYECSTEHRHSLPRIAQGPRKAGSTL